MPREVPRECGEERNLFSTTVMAGDDVIKHVAESHNLRGGMSEEGDRESKSDGSSSTVQLFPASDIIISALTRLLS